MKRILFFVLSIALVSCGAQIKSISTKYRNYSSADLNAVQTSELGNSVYTKGEEEYQDAYIITSCPSFTITMLQYPYNVGDVLPLAGSTQNWDLFYLKDSRTQGSVTYQAGVAKNKKTGEVLPFTNSVNGFKTKEVEGFKSEPTTYTHPDCSRCFKQELIYNGKSGNTLKFMYREYIKDLARPSFFQELQYDLADGNVVGFKGLRIDVIKATNTNIQYKVLSEFTH